MEAQTDRQANEQSSTNEGANGSIADVVARLSRWGRIAPQGLARVEFISEFSRQRVVSQLREHFSQSNIPFYEIELPEQTPAEQIITDLKTKFQSLEPGVVSLSGFETAFPDDIPLLDSLSLLNFNRENLADHPLCQIWWITPLFMQQFVHIVPDLNSWFIVKLVLNETICTSLDESLSLMDQQHNKMVDKVMNRNALRQSAAYVQRFHNALIQQASMSELSGLLYAATFPLTNAGDKDGAYQLEQRLIKELEAAGLDFKAYILSIEGDRQDNFAKAIFLHNLASSYVKQDRYFEAEVLYERALEIKEQLSGANNQNVASTLNNLAALYIYQERYAEAEPLYKRALDIHRRTYGAESLSTAKDLNRLGYLYVLTGRYREAEELYAQATKVDLNAHRGSFYNAECIEGRYVNLLRRLGRLKEAEKLEALYQNRVPSEF